VSLTITKKEGAVERQVLIGMLVSDRVLARIAPRWTSEGLFASKWCNLVAGWCVKYHNKYGKAPRKSVVGMFESWADKRDDPETVKLIERFLSSVSEEYASLKKGINPDYLVDVAGAYFNETALRKLSRAIDGDISSGQVDAARDRVSRFSEVKIGSSAGVSLLDASVIQDAVDNRSEVLFRYPGAVGRFLGDAFARDSFVSFMGPEKSGKTWWLLDAAFRAMKNKVRVAFFEVGDLSQPQIMRRFYTRVCRRPLKKPRQFKPVLRPTKLEILPEGQYDVGQEVVRVTSDMKPKEILERNKRFVDATGDPDILRVSVHPNDSISAAGIHAVVKEWSNQDGKPPGVVVIDYADIIAPPAGFQGESREAVNKTWKYLRRMSQEDHSCVITATQAKATAYAKEQLDMSDFSEDKRKFAHVTGMIGINVSVKDKPFGVTRLNWLVLREDEFVATKEVIVAGSLGLANPCMFSMLG
jgi:RNase H-fold protein (predicted Holliday junction resolvase)